MKKVLSQIELNDERVPNSNILYDIFWDGKLNFEARLSDPNNERKAVSFEDAPKVLKFVMDKPLDSFTMEEQGEILNYRGLKLSDGFEAGDVFMEMSYIKPVEDELKDGQEVTINVPFTYTIGEEGFKTGKVLETIEDCKAEAEAELEDGLIGDIFMEVKK